MPGAWGRRVPTAERFPARFLRPAREGRSGLYLQPERLISRPFLKSAECCVSGRSA
ncbi:hypothetical protein HMPREF9440_00684 [Sutterella parvirubra YIT 11816]|uniref:Uncharacterized protein n=1 Tax=Sutterella parvirubra YIT 11816 TaxID=762967 RepID=H3KD78_9BURK|nr:hypothetical protein HMPREF9440_00684 [Sutterella parvirubra YIT 11816]